MKRRLVIWAVLLLLLTACTQKAPAETQPAPAPQPEVQEPSAPEPEPQPEVQPPAPEPQPEPEVQPDPQEPPAPQPEPEEPEAPDFTGQWRDSGTSGGRCYMEITRADSEYTVDIYWGSSAAETHHWQLFGSGDGEISYIGTHYRETVQEDGEVLQTVMLKGLTGTIWPDEDGALCWTDDNEQTGEGMVFERES